MLKQQLFLVAILVFLLAPVFTLAGNGRPLKQFTSPAKQQQLLLQAKKNTEPGVNAEPAKGFSKNQRHWKKERHWHLPSARN